MSTAGTSTRPRAEQLFSTAHGSVYYRPRSPIDRPGAPPADTVATLPSPRIRPRPRRSQFVRIIPCADFVTSVQERHGKGQGKSARRLKAEKKKRGRVTGPGNVSGSLDSSPGVKLLGLLLSALRLASNPDSLQRPRIAPPIPRRKSISATVASLSRRLSRTESAGHQDATPMRVPAMVDTIRPTPSGAHHRNSLVSVRSAKSIASSSVAGIPKPIASGSGVTCSITLAEPNVFLAGFDHDGLSRSGANNATSLLRGKLQLSVSKNVKLKAITLKLVGKARTEWPEGIPPLKVDQFEEDTLRAQSLVFFHAMHEGIWETEYGNQCTYQLKGSTQSGADPRESLSSRNSAMSISSARSRNSHDLSARELKRLSLQSVKERSFGKGDNPAAIPVQAKGYKVFYPGNYQYAFELPIDHHQLETIKLQYGSVKWELEAVVERAGTFKPNLHGVKEVSIVRVPDQLSLEMSEPISISRQWEDQMHYDIIISGKSFPIGSKIPIAFKLTPLAKVQLHKVKVLVTENVEYHTNDRRVTRRDAGRKILLLEKVAGKPLDKQYEQSEFRVLSGGELSPSEREEARRAAERRRAMEAARTHVTPDPLPEPTENLLGDLDLGLESYWASTEMEMNVQLPTCEMMAKDKALRLNPDCSWKNAQVHHWIKIVLRVSRPDTEDPTGKRRRHFEISIDSPFTVLNCRATQANTLLPQYSGQDRGETTIQRCATACGCPDAQPTASVSPSSSTVSLSAVPTVQERPSPRGSVAWTVMPTPPQAVHFQSSATQRVSNPLANSSTWPLQSEQSNQDDNGRASSSGWRNPDDLVQPRPIELLRYPSYNPPAFDADEPPPPMITPPPNYDVIVGTPSVDGLADYFARLADYEDPNPYSRGPSVRATDGGDYLAGGGADHGEGDTDSTDSGDEDHRPVRIHSGGRVNVANPRTPGGRLVPSRSLELERPAIRLDMSGVLRRNE